jgi:hypothetical protein
MSFSFYESLAPASSRLAAGKASHARRRPPFAFAAEIFALWSALFSMCRSAEWDRWQDGLTNFGGAGKE